MPLIAVGAALVVFLVFGFLAYQAGTGGGGVGVVPGVCDAGLHTASRTVGPGGVAGATAATLTDEQRHVEDVMLRVRLREGLPVTVLEDREAARVPALVDRGLLQPEDDRWVLTLQGRLLADAVVRDLLD